MSLPKIVTDYWQKPIPLRQFDWIASYDGDEPSDNGAMATGEGATEAEAVLDLIDNYPKGMQCEREWKGAPCSACGEPVTWRAHHGFAQGLRQLALGECNDCATWTLVCERGIKQDEAIIDGVLYTVGPDRDVPSRFRGMGGRRFDIEFLDGRKVTSHDLWVTGSVPERFRDRLKDNAEFGGGARRVSLASGDCWESSHVG